MDIEQSIQFDFTRGERVELLGKYKITATEDNLAELVLKDGMWEFKGQPIEQYAAQMDELYSDKDKNY